MSPLESQQADQRAHRNGLFDEGGHHERHAHRDVDSPRLVEEPLILRVVHPGDYSGNGEFLFREKGDHEVVLVVSGSGDHDVDAREAGRVSELTSQPSAATRVRSSSCRSRSTRSMSLSTNRTSCPPGGEIRRDRGADVPCSADCDLH